MFGRLVTAIFWAAIFFALGAWSGGSLKPVGDAVVRGGKAVGHGAREAWNWAFHEGQSGTAAGTTGAGHSVAELSQGAADLAAARQAFANGEVKQAIAGYKAYLAANPADADAHGELGNVYYYNGELGEASQAYYSAALYLLAEGRANDANALVPAIRIGAPALATDLQSRIATAAAAGPVLSSAPTEAATHSQSDTH